MEQQTIKEELETIIEKYGTTQTFIAKQVGVSKTAINLFLHKEEYQLPKEVLERVKNWLDTL